MFDMRVDASGCLAQIDHHEHGAWAVGAWPTQSTGKRATKVCSLASLQHTTS
jgi:hypothetical protein